jgi:hypothetical protein
MFKCIKVIKDRVISSILTPLHGVLNDFSGHILFAPVLMLLVKNQARTVTSLKQFHTPPKPNSTDISYFTKRAIVQSKE